MSERSTFLPEWFESRSFTLSVICHLVLLLVAAFGLPAILPESAEPVPLVMTVEVLPISAMTNIKPSEKPITKKKVAKAPVVKNPEPPKPKPVEKAEPPKPKPEEKVEEKPFDPNEGAEKKKPEVKKEPEKPAPEKKEDELQKLLNDLANEAKESKPDAPNDTPTEENKTRSDAPYDDSLPLSISEQDAIRNQFIPCWSPPMGAKDAAGLIVILKAQYKQDATLIDVKLRPDLQGRYTSDPYFKAAADAAIRAVHRCSPLKTLDASKYGSWKDMELTFDPKAYF